MTSCAMLQLSLRECLLILERLVQAAGVPPGLLPSVRDCALYSAVLPGPGFGGITGQLALLRGSPAEPLCIQTEQPRLVVDCGGQHAWLVAETLVDLAVDRLRRGGVGEVCSVGVAEPGELRVVAGLAERHRLCATIADEGHGIALRLAPRPAARPTLLDRIRLEGFRAASDTWWPLYRASHDALAPDSFESRRHAGTIRIEADGRIVGRNDEDETDLTMLVSDPARIRSDVVPSVS
ncbi:MAG: hypothetical protein ACHQAQ_03590 [Hyphomicrobiales bacterium]